MLLDEREADVVLLMHVPSAIAPAVEIARACAPACAPTSSGARVLSCWLGGDGLDEARHVFEAAGIPTYDTPERAVAAFLQLVNYRRNQESLMQTPGTTRAAAPDIAAARAVIHEALTQGRELLGEPEAKRVLSAYGIPVVQTVVASDAADAARLAEQIGFPVALKIVSPQVTHKSDVGGVALGLSRAAEVRDAAEAMARRLRERAPNAELVGFSVQQMVRRPRAVETIVGATVDATFGPVILFGQGGVAVEVIGDRAVGLPPLNMVLAKELVSRTRIARLLDGYRDRPPTDRQALYLVLTQVSQLVTDLPEVVELDINPLLVDEQGVIALDARVRVARAEQSGVARLAIRPYPHELEEQIEFHGREIVLRPIRPEDEPQHARFLAAVEPQDLQLRFFHVVRAFAHSQLARFTQIDYDREMAFIATVHANSESETLGVVRAISDPDGARAEFAILIRSDVKGQGLGAVLMRKVIGYCRERKIGELVGDVLATNTRMLALARDLGFEITASEDPSVVRAKLALAGAARA